jgi:hypothetical protein
MEVRGFCYKGKGALWQWCVSCKSCWHAQALVPEEWNGTFLNFDHRILTSLPGLINDEIERRTNAGE